MTDWTWFPLSEELTPHDWRCITVFRERAAEYISSVQAMKVGDISIATQRTPDGRYRANVDNVPPLSQLKGLYVEFRLLHAHDEPSNTRRVSDIIKRRVHEPVVRAYVDHLVRIRRSTLVESGAFRDGDRTVRADEIIDLWFNAQIFHSDAEKRDELDRLTRLLSDDLSRTLLFFAVRDAGFAAAALHEVLSELSPQNPRVKVPARFVRKYESASA